MTPVLVAAEKNTKSVADGDYNMNMRFYNSRSHNIPILYKISTIATGKPSVAFLYLYIEYIF